MASNRSDFQEQQDRPEQPANQPAGAERQGWVDEDYYKENPWYGRAKSKPVFSLGHPLPHTSRGKKKKKGKTQKGNSDLEKGQPEAKNEYPYKKRVRIADETDAPLEHHDGDNAEARKVHSSKRGDADQLVRDSTAAGKAHSSKRNDAGQPVYDYVPQESDSQSREDDWETDGDGYEEGKKYKVDGEPVGQRENDEAEEGEVDPDELRNWWARLRAKYPEPLAEFLAVSLTNFCQVLLIKEALIG